MHGNKKKYNSEDYLYGSTRVRAIEAGMPRTDKLFRLCESNDIRDCFRMLSDIGLNADSDSYESALDTLLKDAYTVAEKSVPDKDFLNFYRYQYDCHNLKSAIKCEFRKRDASDLFIDLGTVPAADVEKALALRDFSGYPHNMADAANEAISAYTKSFDPQVIDIIMDKACFLDMDECLAAYGSEYLNKILTYRADIANIMCAVRILENHGTDYGYSDFKNAFIERGKFDKDFYADVFMSEDGRKDLARKINGTFYSSVAEALSKEPFSASVAEKACDECMLGLMTQTNSILCGPEVILAYITKVENEVKNLRIVISGKLCELQPEMIKSHLRTV